MRLREEIAVRNYFSLGSLVFANILVAAIALPAAMVAEHVRLFRPYNPVFVSVVAMLSTQLLLLAVFTAFYDPRRPAARWLSIAAILLGSGVLFMLELIGTNYAIESIRYGGEFSSLDRLLMRLYFSLGATAAVLAGCMGIILVLHIAAWPLRALLGLRLVKPEIDAASNARQFGITHLLAWVGLFAALLWLFRIASDGDQPMVMIAMIAALMLVSAMFVAPWIYLLVKPKIKRWPIIVGLIGIAVLSYLAQEATAQFNFYQITNTKSVAATFLLPSLQFPEYAAFTGTISLVALLNFLALRHMGLCFRRLKPGAMPSHFTTIAPQPSNVMP